MSIHQCTQSFFEHVPELSQFSSNLSIPLHVVQSCFLDVDLFSDLITLNRTRCLESIDNFETGVTYACTYYYLSVQNENKTTVLPNCRQFFHLNANHFDVMPCYTIGENLAKLFAVTTSPLDLTVFALTVVITSVYVFKYFKF